MDETNQHDLADKVGTDVGRLVLMKEIVAKVEGPDSTASDDDLDLWWGSVEIDRLVSGLTLATINKLSESTGEDDPFGPWLQKSDVSGDGPTHLTPDGKEVISRIRTAEGTA